MNKEPICADCHFWRDYSDDIELHPDYDGHCWFRGIMTLNQQECEDHNRMLTSKDFVLPELPESYELQDKDYISNDWLKWKEEKMNDGRKATEKMMKYAKWISEWVFEKLPETDDFTEVSNYITRNKPMYQAEIQKEKWYHEAYMDSVHGDWGDRGDD